MLEDMNEWGDEFWGIRDLHIYYGIDKPVELE